MSRDSRHHRNTAHASPAPKGPTRYRAPEESGMMMELHTIQTSTALLRNANGADAPETNSRRYVPTAKSPSSRLYSHLPANGG